MGWSAIEEEVYWSDWYSSTGSDFNVSILNYALDIAFIVYAI
jgi:hypothetical protein